MPGEVNGDGGQVIPRARVEIDPGPAGSHGSVRSPADAVAARPAANGHVVSTPSPAAGGGADRSGSRPPPPDPAGVVTRLLAAVVDAVVVVVLAALLDLAAAGARFLWSPADFRWPRPTAAVTVAVLLLVAVVYLAAGWALTGRTYGARLMGLRVLSSRHELLGWTRSVLRALVSVHWPIGLLWCGISRTRLSVADILFRSVVVYDVQPYPRHRDGIPPTGPPAA